MGFSLFLKKNLFLPRTKRSRIVRLSVAVRKNQWGNQDLCRSEKSLCDPLDRAVEIFTKLKMEQDRSSEWGTSLYCHKIMNSPCLETTGIYKKPGKNSGIHEVRKMIANFSEITCLKELSNVCWHVGEVLNETFPYEPTEDKNELPDDIVFGRIITIIRQK